MCENLSQVNSVVEKYDIHTDKLTSDLMRPEEYDEVFFNLRRKF